MTFAACAKTHARRIYYALAVLLRRPAPQTALIAAVLVASASLILLDGWRTAQARIDLITADKIETANLATSLAQHARDMLQTADTLVIGLRTILEKDATSPTSIAFAQDLLANEIEGSPLIRDVLAFDRAGNWIVNARSPGARQVNVADRAYFQFHQSHADRSRFIGPPIRSKIDGGWIITLSRRLDDSQGKFAGLVAATISIKTLQNFYKTFDVGTDGAITLSSTNGTLIVREPIDDSSIGKDFSRAPLVRDFLPRSPASDWELVSPIDGIKHVGSYRKIDDFPLVVIVSHGFEEVLAPWRSDALLHATISLSTAVIVIFLGGRFMRQVRLRSRRRRFRAPQRAAVSVAGGNSTDLIVHLGPDCRRLYVSPACEALLGYAPQELVGGHPRDLSHPEDWPRVSRSFTTITRTGETSQVSSRTRRKDGSFVWVEAVARKLDGDQGFIVVLRDIQERMQSDAKLLQAQRMEAVGQLTAGVAHDFNNMLQSQIGALEILLDEVEGQSKANQLATMALTAAEHGAKLTHSLLAFSRQQVLRPEAVSLRALLDQLQAMLARTLDPRIVLEVDIEEDVRAPFADVAQLEAALLNLALNSRDAMHSGGTLSIQACNASTALDVPDGLTRDAFVLIAVSDDGLGMDPDVCAKACEPFFTTKPSGEGTGLGLSMVRGFVDQSGGTLRIRTAPRQGTRVELWLPTTNDPNEHRASPGPLPRGTGRILLVDDDPAVLGVVGELLECVGFEVVQASSGEDALAVVDNGTVLDLLITDFAMPGMDGGALIERARRRQPELLTLIMTGFAEPDRLAAVPANTQVIKKPIRSHDLANAVCDLVASARANGGLSPRVASAGAAIGSIGLT